MRFFFGVRRPEGPSLETASLRFLRRTAKGRCLGWTGSGTPPPLRIQAVGFEKKRGEKRSHEKGKKIAQPRAHDYHLID